MNAFWTFVEAQQSNEFLVGGLALAVLGIAAALLRQLWLTLSRQLWKRLAWSVTIENRSQSYGDLLRWLAETGAFSRLRRFRLDAFDFPIRRDDMPPEAVLTPDAGVFWFVRDGALAICRRMVDDKPIPGRKERLETLTVTLISFGADCPRLFRRWVDRAWEHQRSERDAWPKLYSYGDWGGWSDPGRIRPRPIATVNCRDGVADQLLADARAFLGRESWYVARGVPWRRGYLLHGPPGTGKSSLIRAIASELALDLAVIDLSAKAMTDAGLREALTAAPERAAIVLEDVDAAFSGRDRDEAAAGLTFSGLLNALDGLAAQEGRLVFMTTNHREKLDPALVRPGRADVHAALALATPVEAAAMFARFFPDAAARADALVAGCSGEVSPAAAQAAMLAHADDAGRAFDALARLFEPRVDRAVAAE